MKLPQVRGDLQTITTLPFQSEASSAQAGFPGTRVPGGYERIAADSHHHQPRLAPLSYEMVIPTDADGGPTRRLSAEGHACRRELVVGAGPTSCGVGGSCGGGGGCPHGRNSSPRSQHGWSDDRVIIGAQGACGGFSDRRRTPKLRARAKACVFTRYQSTKIRVE